MGKKRDWKAIEARCIEGARLLKRKVAQAEIARRLDVSRQSVSIWARQLAEVNARVTVGSTLALTVNNAVDVPMAIVYLGRSGCNPIDVAYGHHLFGRNAHAGIFRARRKVCDRVWRNA